MAYGISSQHPRSRARAKFLRRKSLPSKCISLVYRNRHGRSRNTFSRLRRFLPRTMSQQHPDSILPVSEPLHEPRIHGTHAGHSATAPLNPGKHDSESFARESVPRKDSAQISHQSDSTNLHRKVPPQGTNSTQPTEQSGNTHTRPQYANESNKSSDQLNLLLTNGIQSGGELGGIAVPSSSPVGKPEAQYNSARNDFVTDKWLDTFWRRRNERSRGRCEYGAERRSVLRQKPTPTSSRRSSIDGHSDRKREGLVEGFESGHTRSSAYEGSNTGCECHRARSTEHFQRHELRRAGTSSRE